MTERRVDKLDTSDWSEQDCEFVKTLVTVLTKLDTTMIEVHVRLARTAPNWANKRLELRKSVVFSLLAYGREGLEALYGLAVGALDSMSNADALQALVAVGLGAATGAARNVEGAQTYLEDNAFRRLQAAVSATCDDPVLRKFADQLLTQAVHDHVNSPLGHLQLGVLLSGAGMTIANDERDLDDAGRLVLHAIAKGTLAITDQLCAELTNLITQDLPERRYQDFFQQHPALLDPLASSVVPLQNFGEMWRTDFVIRRLDNQYIFVEIEKPQDTAFTAYPQPSVALSHALAQVLNWFVWVEDNISYAQSHGFPAIHSPGGVVVIGRNQNLSSEQRRLLAALNDLVGPRVTIRTFDDVLANARNVLHNLTAR